MADQKEKQIQEAADDCFGWAAKSLELPSLKLTFFAIENRKIPWLENDFSFWDGLVSGVELLVSGSVTCIMSIVASGGYNASRRDIFA